MRLLVVIALCLLGNGLFAQKAFKKAQAHYDAYEYSLALNALMELYEADSLTDRLTKLRMITECHIKQKNYAEAAIWSQKVVTTKKYEPDDIFLYATLLRHTGEYAEAINQFKKYEARKKKLGEEIDDEMINEYVKSCEHAIETTNKPWRWLVVNEQQLNTIYSDFGLTFDQSGFFFSSDRFTDTTEALYKWTGSPYAKLFSAVADTAGHYALEKMPPVFNIAESHSGIISLSANYDTAYFTVTLGKSVYFPTKKAKKPEVNTKKKKKPVVKKKTPPVKKPVSNKGTKSKTASSSKKAPAKKSTTKSGSKTSTSKTKKPVAKVVEDDEEEEEDEPNLVVSKPVTKPDEIALVYRKTKPPVGKNQVLRNAVFYSVKENGKWQDPIAFAYNNHLKYNVQHPALNKRGDTLIFASDMPGGYGKMDLYLCVKDENDEWSEPENLGDSVNTEEDEVFPTFDKEGKLYFASERMNGLGGLDIYKTNLKKTKAEQTWVTPLLMGYPFNSAGDDFGLQWNKQMTRGYISSNRKGGTGRDDIYSLRVKPELYLSLSFQFPQELFKPDSAYIEVEDINIKTITRYPVKNIKDSILIKAVDPRIFKLHKFYTKGSEYPLNKTISVVDKELDSITFVTVKLPVIKLRGRVSDKKTGAAIPITEVDLYNNLTKQTRTIKTDSSGVFGTTVLPEEWYNISFRKIGYIGSDKIDLIVPKVMNDTVITIGGGLNRNAVKIVKGEKIVFRNIYFEYNKADLSDSSDQDIRRMVAFLNENPQVSAEISAHSDSRGKDSYNLTLSQKRARTVINALIRYGVSPKRLTSKGYGETQITNKCKNSVTCSEAEHAVNRRIELKITKVVATSQ